MSKRELSDSCPSEESSKNPILKALIDCISDCVLIKDPDMAYILVNPPVEEFFGMEARHILGKTNTELFGPEAARPIDLQDERVLRGETVREHAGKNTAIGFRDFDIIRSPIRDKAGCIVGICAIARDITHFKQREKSLEKTTEELEGFFSCALDLLCIAGLDGRFRRVNAQWSKTLGYGVDELAGARFLEFIHPDDIEATAEAMKSLSSGDSVLGFINRYRCRDGSYRWIQWRSMPSGDVIYSAARDITEQRDMEEALRASEEKYRLIAENTVDVITVMDLDLRYSFVSPSIFRLTGFFPEEMKEQGLDVIFTPDSLEKLREALEQEKAIEASGTGDPGRSRTMVLELNRKDRGVVVVETTLSFLRDREGSPAGVLGVSRDVTSRKQWEDRLVSSELRVRTVLESLPEGVVAADTRTGEFVYANQAFLKMLGCSSEELKGFTLKDIHPSSALPAITEQFQAAVRGLSTGHPEVPLLRRDGSVLSAELRNAFLEIDGRKCLLGVFTDITERKRAEKEKANLQAQLNQISKMDSVGRLAGGVAHDFNNMLGVILGYADLAAGKIPSGHPVESDLKEIVRAARHSADLTGQLLAFARKQEVTPVVLDLNRVVEGMLRVLERLIGEHIELEWLPAEGLWPVLIDPNQVGQILTNLAVNARDAITGVGTLSLSTKNVCLAEASPDLPGLAPGDFVLLSVADDGHGFDENCLEYAFEPFFTTKGQGRGTGLGLATVYGVVKQNRGGVYISSAAGQGTTVKVYLPRTEKIPDPEALPGTCPTSGGGETILLVEDEDSILNLSAMILEQAGYTVLKARGPTEALALLKTRKAPVHLLISDVVMPDMNGRDLRKLVEARIPGIRVLFISGYTSDILASHGITGREGHFLQKPFLPGELVDEVVKVLNDG